MLLRTTRRASRALSPYAQALKHIALRGKVALGPSAKEAEIAMYRQGSLPADYRPPVHGKWDDTIERWAYAWQFPIKEGGSTSESRRVAQLPQFQKIIAFARKLIEAPPLRLASEAKGTASSSRSTAADVEEVERSPQFPRQDLNSNSIQVVADSTKSVNVMPAAQFIEKLNLDIPVAYVDDGSEQSQYSKELGLIIVEDLELPYDMTGINTLIAALGRNHCPEEARALLSFAEQIGFVPTSVTFSALMGHYAIKGDVNQCMAIVEETKERGITPARENWTQLMLAFYKAGDFPAVMQIVDNMKAFANIEPDEITFQYQILALARDRSRESNIYEAIQLFDQMENVYGFLPTRRLYHALLRNLAYSSKPEMRTRAEEISTKMEMLGMLWDGETYFYMIQTAGMFGDLERVKQLFSKMRDERVPMRIDHLERAISAHTNALLPHIMPYEKLKEEGKSPLPVWLEHITTCFGMYDLVLRRGWRPRSLFIDNLLRLCCTVTALAVEHIPDDKVSIAKFEEQSRKLWDLTYAEVGVRKSSFSYEQFISMLAHLERIDEAEKAFQELILTKDMVPTQRTYETLMYMHLTSGEEGGTARALSYLEAMERAKIPIRASTIRKFVRMNDNASFKRDMKRRARRIMQAREEYLRRKAEREVADEDAFENAMGAAEEDGESGNRKKAEASIIVPHKEFDVAPYEEKEESDVLKPLPIAPNSPLAWWEKWKQETMSKHELFEVEKEDGTPQGDDRVEALKKLGITSSLTTADSLPKPDKHRLLPKMRAEGEDPAGSLWALDGGDMTYPERSAGPDGWGVTLWRERQMIRAELQKAKDGKSPLPELSAVGNAHRPVPDQLLIERTGVKTPGELADVRDHPTHVYDDGTPKPKSEFAVSVPPSAEMVWQQQSKDPLAPFMTDEELIDESDNYLLNELTADRKDKISKAIQVIQDKQEDVVEVVGRGSTRKSKFDYLAKFKEMYQHGTLEAPDDPVLRFGRTPDDGEETLAATIRGWYDRQRRSPPSESQVARWKEEADREKEFKRVRNEMQRRKRSIRVKHRKRKRQEGGT